MLILLLPPDISLFELFGSSIVSRPIFCRLRYGWFGADSYESWAMSGVNPTWRGLAYLIEVSGRGESDSRCESVKLLSVEIQKFHQDVT